MKSYFVIALALFALCAVVNSESFGIEDPLNELDTVKSQDDDSFGVEDPWSELDADEEYLDEPLDQFRMKSISCRLGGSKVCAAKCLVGKKGGYCKKGKCVCKK